MFQQESPQEARKGSTWGPDAGSKGRAGRRKKVVRDQIDENYEDALRMLTPFRCCPLAALFPSKSLYHVICCLCCCKRWNFSVIITF